MENAENELQQRFKELGWTYATLAARVAELRGTPPDEMKKAVNNIKSTVIKCLNNPENSSVKLVRTVVEAMYGECLGYSWLPTSKTNKKSD